jgi:pimeloyl-ACP methyl ester carboxylesterase
MATVSVEGTQIWYQVTGKGSPLVLSGGFGLLHNQWDFVRERLAQHHQVIDWNYRGSGLSDRSWPGGVFHQDRWVEDLEAILNHLGVSRAVLWGTSTGSPLSIRYAARFPKRVRAVITYPMFKADVGFRKAFDGFTMVGETFGYEALAALTSWIGVSSENLFTARHGELARWEAEIFKQNFSIESLGAIMEIVAANDFGADVDKLKMPTCLLMGRSGVLGYDNPGNKALADEFIRRAPQTQLTLIPRGGGTYCMIEEPEATARAALDFIRGLPA